VPAEEIDGFAKHLMKSREGWQVKQAKEAIQLFIYYRRCKTQTEAKTDLQSDALWQKVALDMITVLCLKHRALSTEKIYLGWRSETSNLCYVSKHFSVLLRPS
jgi:predicted nuclease of restriction endonuclease-like (RecB) superfamily